MRSIKISFSVFALLLIAAAVFAQPVSAGEDKVAAHPHRHHHHHPHHHRHHHAHAPH